MNIDVNHRWPEPEEASVKKEKVDDLLYPRTASPGIKKVKRTWKKPKDKPKRPLSSYNMFFQNTRERIVAGKEGDPTINEIKQSIETLLKSKVRGPKRRQDRISHRRISFGDLARAIADKWKTIDEKTKAIYDKYAGLEKARYKKEVLIWKNRKENEHDARMIAKHANHIDNNSNIKMPNTGINPSLGSSASSSEASTLSSLPSSLYNNLSEYSIFNNNPSSYPLFNNLCESIVPSRPQAPTSKATSIMRQYSDDAVIRRQQDILRKQMGFDEKWSLLLTSRGVTCVDERGDRKDKSNMDNAKYVLNNKRLLSESGFSVSDPVGSNINNQNVLSAGHGSSLLGRTPLLLQQQHQSVSDICLSSTEEQGDQKKDNAIELEKIKRKLQQLKQQQTWMQQQILEQRRNSSTAINLNLKDVTIFASSSLLNNNTVNSLNQPQQKIDHRYDGLFNNPNDKTSLNKNTHSSVTGSFQFPLRFHSGSQSMNGLPLSNDGIGIDSSSFQDSFQSTNGNGCWEQQQEQSSICRNSVFGSEESAETMIGKDHDHDDGGFSNVFSERHSSCPVPFYTTAATDTRSNHDGQEQSLNDNKCHNSLGSSIFDYMDNSNDNLRGGIIQGDSEPDNDDISLVSFTPKQELTRETYTDSN